MGPECDCTTCKAIELLQCAADLALTGRGVFVTACALCDEDTTGPVASYAHRAWLASGVYGDDHLELLDAVALIRDGAV